MPRLIDDDHDSTPLLATSREKESSSPWLSSSKRTILFIALLLTCFSAVFGIHSSPRILAAGGEINGSGQKSYLPLASLGANGGGIIDAGDELNHNMNNNNMNRNNNMNNMNHKNIERSEKDQALLRNEFNDEEDMNMNVNYNNNNDNKKELDKKRSSKDNNNNNEKNKEISTTKIPTPPDELPQGRKRLFSLFTIYRKNVAPQLGDFKSFAKDFFNDKPAAKSNEDDEDYEADYDEETSNSHAIGGW